MLWTNIDETKFLNNVLCSKSNGTMTVACRELHDNVEYKLGYWCLDAGHWCGKAHIIDVARQTCQNYCIFVSSQVTLFVNISTILHFQPPPIRLCILGPKSCGKTEQGRSLARKLGLFHISFHKFLEEMIIPKVYFKQIIGVFALQLGLIYTICSIF